jgi:hypothetical protein
LLPALWLISWALAVSSATVSRGSIPRCPGRRGVLGGTAEAAGVACSPSPGVP